MTFKGVFVKHAEPRFEPVDAVRELESRIRLGQNFGKWLPVPIADDGKLHFFERGVPAVNSITSICGHTTFGQRIRGREGSGSFSVFDTCESIRVAVENFSRHVCAHCAARALG